MALLDIYSDYLIRQGHLAVEEVHKLFGFIPNNSGVSFLNTVDGKHYNLFHRLIPGASA